MPRPITPTRELLDAIGCNSNSTVEIYLRDGRAFYLSTTDFNLSPPGYDEPFVPGLVRVGEIEENLGRATSGVGLKIANEYEGDINFWHKLDCEDGNPLSDAEVVIKNFRRDGEAEWTVYSHDYYFAGRLAKTDCKESVKEDKQTNTAVIERWIDLDVVLDTTAAGLCLATQTLSPANGFIAVEAADVSSIPTGGGIGGTGSGGASSGGAVDNNGNPIDCFIAGTLISTATGAVPIEKISNLDEVLSFNPQTLKIETDKVIATIEKIVDSYLELTFANNRSVSVTRNHRFLIGKNEWRTAAQLKKGDSVYVETGGSLHLAARLESSAEIKKEVKVYNLQVLKNHTYLANNFAVHNTKRNPYDIGVHPGLVY